MIELPVDNGRFVNVYLYAYMERWACNSELAFQKVTVVFGVCVYICKSNDLQMSAGRFNLYIDLTYVYIIWDTHCKSLCITHYPSTIYNMRKCALYISVCNIIDEKTNTNKGRNLSYVKLLLFHVRTFQLISAIRCVALGFSFRTWILLLFSFVWAAYIHYYHLVVPHTVSAFPVPLRSFEARGFEDKGTFQDKFLMHLAP